MSNEKVVVINISILAMSISKKDKKNVDKYVKNNLDIDLNDFNDDTKVYIGNIIKNRYSVEPEECKPFHEGDSIINVINSVVKDIKVDHHDCAIQPYSMSINADSSSKEKYDFIEKEHIRIIEAFSLTEKETEDICELFEKQFKRSCLILCCCEMPHELRVKLNEIRNKRLPFLTMYKESIEGKYKQNINLKISDKEFFVEKLGFILFETYIKMMSGSKPVTNQPKEILGGDSIVKEKVLP